MHTSKKPLLTNFTFLTFLFCSTLIFWAPCAFATDYTWVKGSDGNWDESTSWNPEGVPNGDSDTAAIETVADVTVTMNGSYTLGGLTVGSGDSLTMSDGAWLTIGSSGSGGTLTNNGTIFLNSTTTTYTQLIADGNVTLSGNGTLTLGQEVYARLGYGGSGGSFTNNAGHIIQGKGQLSTTVNNMGTIVADGGILWVNAAATNAGATMTTAGSSGILKISATVSGGSINPGSGTVRLEGATLDGTSNDVTIGTGAVEMPTGGALLKGNVTSGADIVVNDGVWLTIGSSGSGGTLTNNGTIFLNSTTTTYTQLIADGNVTLSGNGTLTLGQEVYARLGYGGSGGSFTNNAVHTIKGTGRILADINNNGEIIAQNGTLTIQSPVTGAGSVETADNGTLDIQQNLGTGDFTMANLGTLQVAINRVVTLTGDFTFYQTDETKWNWSVPSSLQMSGAGTQNQTLEVGGLDQGEQMAGFSDNFELPGLLLENSGTVVTLVDEIDNGNRSSPEALYTYGLYVNTGTTLYLNGLNLYTTIGGEVPIPVQVTPGSQLFGGGTIASIPAGTYYVDIQNGSDSNDGSAGHPWKTLHHAVELINGGESGNYVLYVASGTYAVNQQNVENGEADEPMLLSKENVTIVGSADTPPVIDGAGAENWSTGLEMTGSNLQLVNMSITGFSDDDEKGVYVMEGINCQIRSCFIHGNNWGIHVYTSDNTRIAECDIFNNSTHGIDVSWGSGNLVINNKIHDNPKYGIRAESSPEIYRNLIYDNAYGIYVEAPTQSSASPSPIIQNNVIYQATSGAVSYGIAVIVGEYVEVANPEIYYNTIDGGTLSGIKMENYSSSSPVIKYNIITNFGQYGIDNDTANPASPTIDYNDVWNTSAIVNYQGCAAGAHDITPPADPKYASYSLQSDSPCINTIPPAQEDPVDVDYPGYLRPRPGEENKDMGAYEYVADETVDYTLPTGTGLETDYRIFSIPLSLGTGADMLTAMENVLETYDNTTWRGFLYNGTGYDEFISGAFASHSIVPGTGYWIITTLENTIPFTGKPAPDGVDYFMDLAPGWHIIAPPWSDATVYLGNIEVTDGVNTYPLVAQPYENQLTQRFLWDYTGEDNQYYGYVQRSSNGFFLQNDTGYFINVLSDKAVRLIMPIGEGLGNGVSFDTAPSQAKTVQPDETPPPPPGSTPMADIKANGMDGPVSVAKGDPVSITVKLDPGAWIGRNADWWVAAHTPFDPPGDWYTYVHPNGWGTGIHACLQTPIFEVMSPFPVLNMVLPPGGYTFYFAVDGNMDGKPDATWLDTVQVTVE